MWGTTGRVGAHEVSLEGGLFCKNMENNQNAKRVNESKDLKFSWPPNDKKLQQ